MRGKKKPARPIAKAKSATTIRARRGPAPRGSTTPSVEQRLAEALEQQAATSEILRVISSSPHDAQPVFEAIVANAARLCEAEFSAVARFSGGLLHLAAMSNMSPGEIEAYHSLFPRPPHRGFIIGRAFVEGRPVHVADVREDPDYEPRTLEVLQRAAPYRTFLGIPIRRNGVTIGAIGCGRRDVRPFTPSQIELVKTFADQAAIAIENVRLFTAAETRNRDLTETLEQQTATAEILRVISSSPTDVQPVFDTIAKSAARLCEAFDVVIMRRDGDRVRLVAHHGPIPAGIPGEFTLPLDRATIAGRSILEGQTLHIADLQAEEVDYPGSVAHARRFGFRAILSAPLMRGEVAIGAIHLRRVDAVLFTERQVSLLKTFSDQAVIAIENVRLFTELEARNRDLTQTLEQQTATGEILRVISSSPTDVQPVFDTIAESAARLCEATEAHIWQREGDRLKVVASHGDMPLARRELAIGRLSVIGRAAADRQAIHVKDLAETFRTEFPDSHGMKELGYRTILAMPLLREGEALGVIMIRRTEVRPFSDRQMSLLQTFADQAVIAIENVRLFKELEVKNRDLTETLEQQTATGEILRVISGSPTDAQPVFDTIARSARRLCGAEVCQVFRVEDGQLHNVANDGQDAAGLDAIRASFPRPVDRGTSVGRAVLTAAVVEIPDVQADPDYSASMRKVGQAVGFRSLLAVPILRDGAPIGAIAVGRLEAGLFPTRQVELLKTFAEQAVIAIQNVRLFKELEVRNRDLTETLEQQTATGEILRVISRSPTDVQPVFDTIVERAHRLCEADSAALFTYDGTLVHLATLDQTSSEQARALREAYPMPASPGHATGRAILSSRPVHIPDIREDPAYGLDRLRDSVGLRTLLSVPMIRDGVPMGAITVQRWGTPRPFSDKQVALLETFAEQAVIAIENVRLFKELEVRNRDLTETLEQQTATSEILRVISRSPTDAQPVFDIIGERAEKLCDAAISVVSRFDGELLHLVSLHGVAPEGEQTVRDAFPMRPDDETISARSVKARAVVHVADVLADAAYQQKGAARAGGYRGCLAVPMLRDGRVIGSIFVARTVPGLFTDTQVELLKTFADQAVIAVQNVRLFTELEARNHDLTETLEQQTATGEILRVISSSPTDVQPVFEAIVESAVRLCEAAAGALLRFDGEMLHIGTVRGPQREEMLRTWGRFFPYQPGPEVAIGQAVLERRVIHIPDVFAVPDNPFRAATQRAGGYRSFLAVPMLREGSVVGVIACWRAEARAFGNRHISLIETFADQAVIAIENVRLFKELEVRNRDLTETLEQQTATGEILRVISSSPTDVQPVFDSIAESGKRLCEAERCFVFQFQGDVLDFVAHQGLTEQGLAAMRDVWPSRPNRSSAAGRSVIERRVVNIPDVHADPEYLQHRVAAAANFSSVLGVPMMREGVAIGAITVNGAKPAQFTDRHIELIKTFADQAIIAIENVRLFKELEVRNRDLTVTLEQQTATGEILRVISSSPTDVQPVFDTIAQNAKRLCEAEFCHIFRFDGGLLHFVGHHGLEPEGIEAIRRAYPLPPGRASAAARAVLSGRIEQIPDVEADPDYAHGAIARLVTYRSIVGVPLLQDGRAVGAIAVARSEAGLFPARQLELLTTFADQAVIALQNVRLFQELDARTQDLTRSVGELKALGEVSQAVSSTLDLEAVLVTIVSRAVQLSGSYSGIVYEYEESTETFHARATHQITPEYLEVLRSTPIHLGEGAMGTAAVIQKPVQVADIQDERQLVAAQARAHLIRQGLRSLLAMPLIREGRLLGGLVILRREIGMFAPEVVATMQTFATQSVLAIQNARLFVEIQRQRQYAGALVETSPVAITTVDATGTVLGWNPAAVRLFGHTEAEAVGRRVEDLVGTPETREEIRGNVSRILGGERLHAIGRRIRKDGSLVDVEMRSMPLVVDGAEVGFIATYHDITELLKARQEAEAANEAKSAFLATMSHEIRTPMNAVIGMSGLLLNTSLNDEQREYAEIVRQSGDTLLTVINDILDFSKIEAGRLELETQPFDLRECVEGALDLVATRAAEKGLDLAYLIGEGTPAAIVGDVTRLRQVLLNLLSNAVKFTERGEVVLSVTAGGLEGTAGLHELIFAVRDTGIGIPTDRLDRLFQSFSQVDASTTRRYGGTGLGLAISQRLTELMGGRITVKSEVGTGSEFRFTIRAARADAPVPIRRDLTGVQPSLRGKHVLVVDDNATNRRILASHLEAWGMHARVTESPREALGWVRGGERFDLGILDMHMPEMDGVALAQAIRQTAPAATLPLVLFTSLGRREARAEEAGFAAYLNKPIKPSQLFDALISILGDQPVHVPQRSAARSELDPELARRHPLRILLAEDNVVNQKVATRLLAQMGYRADVAANGLEAIAAVERQTYDVVLMDVQMPELDGFEASREINRRWPADRPRIVAMTANAMEGDRELCVAAGMDDYVAKPIRVEELVGALGRCRPRVEAPPRGSAAPEKAPAADVLDRAVLEGLGATMGREFAVELIDTFIADARELVAVLRRARAGTDRDAFRRAAHTLKSTSESLGAFALAAQARELEVLGQAGRLHEVGDRVDRLADMSERVARALGEIRRDLA